MQRNEVFVSVYIIVIFVLLTRLDYVVNGILYDYGLFYSVGWYNSYSVCYFWLWQFALLSLYLWQRNLRLLLALEIVLYTWLPDIVYFLLWDGGFPTGDWTWMPLYKLFGAWTTAHQIILSISGLSLALTILFLPFKKSMWLKK